MSLQDILLMTDIFENVMTKCNLREVECLSAVNKQTHEMTQIQLAKLKIDKLTSDFPYFFKNHIDFKKLALLSPRLIVNDHRYGATGYIDYITHRDFDTHNTNILYGYDSYNRFFISTMYIYLDKEDPQRRIATFFQRYSDSRTFYVSCGNTYNSFSDCQTYNFVYPGKDMAGTQYETLFNLLNHSDQHPIRLAPIQ